MEKISTFFYEKRRCKVSFVIRLHRIIIICLNEFLISVIGICFGFGECLEIVVNKTLNYNIVLPRNAWNGKLSNRSIDSRMGKVWNWSKIFQGFSIANSHNDLWQMIENWWSIVSIESLMSCWMFEQRGPTVNTLSK